MQHIWRQIDKVRYKTVKSLPSINVCKMSNKHAIKLGLRSDAPDDIKVAFFYKLATTCVFPPQRVIGKPQKMEKDGYKCVVKLYLSYHPKNSTINRKLQGLKDWVDVIRPNSATEAFTREDWAIASKYHLDLAQDEDESESDALAVPPTPKKASKKPVDRESAQAIKRKLEFSDESDNSGN